MGRRSLSVQAALLVTNGMIPMVTTTPILRTAAGAIALITWVGLAVQFSASMAQLGSVPETLWVMLRYFTILTNVLVAVVFSGIALGKYAFGSPFVLGGATLAIVLVGVVYTLLLRGLLELNGGAKTADFILHDVAPVLVPLFWLFFAPKGALKGRDPLLWVIYPVAYIIYGLARGAIEHKYAYPFMDVAQIGLLKALINIVLIALSFLVVGIALVWLDRLLGRRRKTAR
jgi:hypothetical protein